MPQLEKYPHDKWTVNKGKGGGSQSVSLSHDQIAFVIESLERRREKPAGVNPMVNSWLEGINDEVNGLLAIITPCASVSISH